MVLTRSSASLDSGVMPESQCLADDAVSSYKSSGVRKPAVQSPGQDITPSRRSSRLAKRRTSKLEVVQETDHLHGDPTDQVVVGSTCKDTAAVPSMPSLLEEGEKEEVGAEEDPREQLEQEEEGEEEEELLQIMAAAVRNYCQPLVDSSGDGPRTSHHEVRLPSWSPDITMPQSRDTDQAADADDGSGLRTVMGNQELYVSTMNTRRKLREEARKAPKTKGPAWFDLPAQSLDEETKQHLRLLRLRGAYDPKRFYKTFDTTKLPVHFQVGTVVNGAADFYAGRLSKTEARSGGITQQLLADEQVTHHRRKRYGRMQEDAQRWSSSKRRQGNKSGPGAQTKKQRRPKPKH